MKVVWLAALLGSGLLQTPVAPNPYRALDAWAQLPAGMEWGQVSGVELDARGNVWVIHRADPPILAIAMCFILAVVYYVAARVTLVFVLAKARRDATLSLQ